MKLSNFYLRFQWQVICLCLMLQRSPVWQLLARAQTSISPRVVHVFRMLFAATITSATYNTVTGATGDMAFAKDNTGVLHEPVPTLIGEDLLIAVDVKPKAIPVEFLLIGTLPQGLSFQFSSRIALISGIPTESGNFPVTIRVNEWENPGTDGQKRKEISFVIEIIGEGPDILQQPANTTIDWGSNTELSITVTEPSNITFQWQIETADSLGNFEDLAGETTNTLSFTQATSDLSANYRVIATDSKGSTYSQIVTLLVDANSLEIWKEFVLSNPFSAEADDLADSDLDSLVNLVEYAFGLNPNSPQPSKLPKTHRETINNQRYLVYEFPAIPANADCFFLPEISTNLASSNWTPISNGQDGAIIESTSEGYFIKLPLQNSIFCRLRVRYDQ